MNFRIRQRKNLSHCLDNLFAGKDPVTLDRNRSGKLNNI